MRIERDPAADFGRPIGGEPAFRAALAVPTFQVYLIALTCIVTAFVLFFRPFRGPFERWSEHSVNFHGVGNVVNIGDHNVKCARPKANLFGPGNNWIPDWRQRLQEIGSDQALVISQGSPPDSAKVIGQPCFSSSLSRVALATLLFVLGPILLIMWIVARGKRKGFSWKRRMLGAVGGVVALAGGFPIASIPVVFVFFFPEGS